VSTEKQNCFLTGTVCVLRSWLGKYWYICLLFQSHSFWQNMQHQTTSVFDTWHLHTPTISSISVCFETTYLHWDKMYINKIMPIMCYAVQTIILHSLQNWNEYCVTWKCGNKERPCHVPFTHCFVLSIVFSLKALKPEIKSIVCSKLSCCLPGLTEQIFWISVQSPRY